LKICLDELNQILISVQVGAVTVILSRPSRANSVQVGFVTVISSRSPELKTAHSALDIAIQCRQGIQRSEKRSRGIHIGRSERKPKEYAWEKDERCPLNPRPPPRCSRPAAATHRPGCCSAVSGVRVRSTQGRRDESDHCRGGCRPEENWLPLTSFLPF
jgi:hypothetical protein